MCLKQLMFLNDSIIRTATNELFTRIFTMSVKTFGTLFILENMTDCEVTSKSIQGRFGLSSQDNYIKDVASITRCFFFDS